MIGRIPRHTLVFCAGLAAVGFPFAFETTTFAQVGHRSQISRVRGVHGRAATGPASNLVFNGGFESPITEGSKTEMSEGNWVGPGAVITSSPAPVHSGAHSAECSSGCSYLHQDIPVPMGPYRFAFSVLPQSGEEWVEVCFGWDRGNGDCTENDGVDLSPQATILHSDGTATNLKAVGPLAYGQWHNLALVRTSSSVSLTIDGANVATTAVSSSGTSNLATVFLGNTDGTSSPYNFYYDDVSLKSAGSFLTPDVSVVQYISAITQDQCVSQLRRSLGMGSIRAGAACVFLVATANPKPPPELASASEWLAFIQSREYRGYIHLPQMLVSCNRGKPQFIDGQSITNVGTQAVPLNLPDFSWSPGWTPPRPVSLLPGADYEPAEEYTNGPDDLGYLFDDIASLPEVSVHKNGTVVVSFLGASRLATLARTLAFGLIGRDAPFIWSVLQFRFNCAGSEAVAVANSEFPTTNLYISGHLKSWYTENHLGDFTKDGQKKINAPGVGLLALDPTCGTSLRWAKSKGQLQAKVPPGHCLGVVLGGPNGGYTGDYL